MGDLDQHNLIRHTLFPRVKLGQSKLLLCNQANYTSYGSDWYQKYPIRLFWPTWPSTWIFLNVYACHMYLNMEKLNGKKLEITFMNKHQFKWRPDHFFHSHLCSRGTRWLLLKSKRIYCRQGFLDIWCQITFDKCMSDVFKWRYILTNSICRWDLEGFCYPCWIVF